MSPDVGPGFRLVAHRGASAEAPENTAAAFVRALELGAAEVELDLRRARDGRLVLFHDERLRPKVERDGRAEDYPLDELTALDIGGWFDRQGVAELYAPELGWERPELPAYAGAPLLGFEAYLAQFGSAFVHHVELKGGDADLPDLTLDTVQRRELDDRVVITSFNLAHLRRARALALAPGIVTGWLVGRGEHLGSTAAALDRCADLGIRQFCADAGLVTSTLVAAARERGLQVRAAGVRTPADLHSALAAGAIGTTVNWIRQAAQIVGPEQK